MQLSSEFIAFLRAGLFSQVMLENVANRLGAAFLPENYTAPAQKGIQKLDTWIKELEDGLPLLSTSWSTPDTFDAINAMGFMKDLKRDLMWMAEMVEAALSKKNLNEERIAAKIIAASLFRSATNRVAYLNTLNNLYVKLKAPEKATQAASELGEAQSYLQTTATIVEIFSGDKEYAPELCEKLRLEALLNPAELRAKAHEARIFLNVYTQQFDFEAAEIPEDIAKPWSEIKVPAVAAGYWYAYRFTPKDCLRWAAVGIRAAPLAAAWRRAQFDPESAIEWAQRGVHPMVAMEWARAGFDAPKAVALMQKGINHPSKASQQSYE